MFMYFKSRKKTPFSDDSPNDWFDSFSSTSPIVMTGVAVNAATTYRETKAPMPEFTGLFGTDVSKQATVMVSTNQTTYSEE